MNGLQSEVGTATAGEILPITVRVLTSIDPLPRCNRFDSNAIETLAAANKAQIPNVDVYMFPCRGKSATEQVIRQTIHQQESLALTAALSQGARNDAVSSAFLLHDCMG